MQKIKTFESFSQEDFEPTQIQPFQEKPEVDHTEDSYSDGAEYEHYMFFNNLKTIQRNIEELLQLDAHEVNEILSNGHAWADDHIATSSDDIEEVKNFLVNELSSSSENLIQEEPTQY
jgi:hypothetical protein